MGKVNYLHILEKDNCSNGNKNFVWSCSPLVSTKTQKNSDGKNSINHVRHNKVFTALTIVTHSQIFHEVLN